MAERQNLGGFAVGLSRLKISAGFVVPSGSGIENAWWDEVQFDPDDTVSLEEVLRRFRAVHPDYAATIRGNTVRVSHLDLRDPLILSHVADSFVVSELYLVAAFRLAMRLIDPSIPYYGNIVVGAGNPPLGPRPRVSVGLEGTTVGDVFDAIACAVPGTVWELTRRQDPGRGEFFTLKILKPWASYNAYDSRLYTDMVRP